MTINKFHGIVILLTLISISEAFSWKYESTFITPTNRKRACKHSSSQRRQLHSSNTQKRHVSSVSKFPAKIIGGSDASRHEFPFMVPVHLQDRYWCGGAIVSPTWVISAAHCYDKPNRQRNLKVSAGMLLLIEHHPDIQTHAVGDVVLHPKYRYNEDKNILLNDIALLRLTGSLSFNDAVKPINLPHPNQTFSGVAKMLGWGKIQLSPPMTPSVLQFIVTPIITLDECKKLYNNSSHYKLCPTMICTLPCLHQQACRGDSGSPLVQNGILVGIVSWGDTFCGTLDDKKIPDVCTRVSRYIHFIKKHVKDISRNFANHDRESKMHLLN